MFAYVRACVCVCVGVYVCIYVCMLICMYVRMYVQQDYIHPVIMHDNLLHDSQNPYDPLTIVTCLRLLCK